MLYIISIFLFIFSNLGKGEGERDNNALNIIHKSSYDDLQSVYFISKLFPITRKDFFKIHLYISSVEVYDFILSKVPNLCWEWKDKTLFWWVFPPIIACCRNTECVRFYYLKIFSLLTTLLQQVFICELFSTSVSCAFVNFFL